MDNQNLSDRDIDILITLGSAEYVKQIEASCPDGDVEMSPRFQQNMNSIIMKHKNREKFQAKRKVAGLIAACITIVFSLGFLSSVSVNAFGMKDFFISVFEKYFSIGQLGENQNTPDINSPIKMMYSDLYLPYWLPDGFEYQDFYEGDDFYIIVYKSDNQIIRFTQTRLYTTFKIDNEVDDYQEIIESGVRYYMLQNVRESIRSTRLVWMIDQYQLMIESSIDSEIVIKIANNVEHYKN